MALVVPLLDGDWRTFPSLKRFVDDTRYPICPSPNGFYMQWCSDQGIQLKSTQHPRSTVTTALFASQGRTIRGKKELLFRAIGDKRRFPCVWDVTAGLARDARMLFDFGYQVVMEERHPSLYLMLLADLEAQKSRFGSLQLRPWQAVGEGCPEGIDVVYYDPMYPRGSKSEAKTALQLAWMREIVGSDSDTHPTAMSLMGLQNKRLVIKRPRRAPPLLPSPDHQFQGKSVRYDMYLTNPSKARQMESSYGLDH